MFWGISTEPEQGEMSRSDQLNQMKLLGIIAADAQYAVDDIRARDRNFWAELKRAEVERKEALQQLRKRSQEIAKNHD